MYEKDGISIATLDHEINNETLQKNKNSQKIRKNIRLPHGHTT